MTDFMATNPAGTVDSSPGRRLPGWFRHGEAAALSAGIGATVLGFIFILMGWGEVAGARTVAKQVPALLGWGATGLALVIVGVAIVDITARREDARARRRQSGQLLEALVEVTAAVRSSGVGPGRGTRTRPLVGAGRGELDVRADATGPSRPVPPATKRGTWRRDPSATSLTVLVLLMVGGAGSILLGWRGAAATGDVSAQLPYLISGAVGGLALLAFALGATAVQLRRRDEATQRQETAGVIAAAQDLLAEVQGR